MAIYTFTYYGPHPMVPYIARLDKKQDLIYGVAYKQIASQCQIRETVNCSTPDD